MKIQTLMPGRLVGLGLLTAFCVSCVTQEEYQRAVDLAEMYQDEKHDLEKEVARLSRMRDNLEGEVRSAEASFLQNGGDTTNYEAELNALQDQLKNLGRAPKEIERFDVDGGYVYMIQDKVLFESGSAEISAPGKSALIELVGNIQGAPHGKIFVRGHTDSDPVKRPETLKKFPHGNLQLSAARAVAVAAILTGDAKLPDNNVVVMGFGSHDPVAPNDSPDSKRLNRRVEIFVADASAKR